MKCPTVADNGIINNSLENYKINHPMNIRNHNGIKKRHTLSIATQFHLKVSQSVKLAIMSKIYVLPAECNEKLKVKSSLILQAKGKTAKLFKTNHQTNPSESKLNLTSKNLRVFQASWLNELDERDQTRFGSRERPSSANRLAKQRFVEAEGPRETTLAWSRRWKQTAERAIIHELYNKI
ncbi:hypothetical protein WN51_07595 [Melipona quadrifasciata]|uniref:Uncharacterized protein n=1 Tax=Melipona quadrifasciata TaxID=166423 RepID=A0A0N0U375_9HYME|nr:hypothetical protein WN51_07595 [Melipona quadrifasciata]